MNHNLFLTILSMDACILSAGSESSTAPAHPYPHHIIMTEGRNLTVLRLQVA